MTYLQRSESNTGRCSSNLLLDCCASSPDLLLLNLLLHIHFLVAYLSNGKLAINPSINPNTACIVKKYIDIITNNVIKKIIY